MTFANEIFKILFKQKIQECTCKKYSENIQFIMNDLGGISMREQITAPLRMKSQQFNKRAFINLLQKKKKNVIIKSIGVVSKRK